MLNYFLSILFQIMGLEDLLWSVGCCLQIHLLKIEIETSTFQCVYMQQLSLFLYMGGTEGFDCTLSRFLDC